VVFEGEEVGDCEEVGVGRGGFGREEGGGLVEGMGRCVDDLVGEVVEDGGLWGGEEGVVSFFFLVVVVGLGWWGGAVGAYIDESVDAG